MKVYLMLQLTERLCWEQLGKYQENKEKMVRKNKKKISVKYQEHNKKITGNNKNISK